MVRALSLLFVMLLGACGRTAPAPVVYGADPYERWLYNDAPRSASATAPTQPFTAAIQNGFLGHTVKKGETLQTIGQKYRLTAGEIAVTNRLRSPYRLEVGQRLAIPTRVATHTVQRGETLYSVARRYSVDLYELAALNTLPRPYAVHTGQTLRVPTAAAPPAVAARRTLPNRTPPQTRQDNRWWPWANNNRHVASNPPPRQKIVVPPPPPRSSNRFSWPVVGRVISGFGSTSGGQQNDGINIAAPEGTPVRAAENGVVAYADDSIRGYGNMVLLKHGGGWITTYAQNSRLEVYQGQRVQRGQVIARSGNRGHVHFEVRSGKRPVNPMNQLESQRFANTSSSLNSDVAAQISAWR